MRRRLYRGRHRQTAPTPVPAGAGLLRGVRNGMLLSLVLWAGIAAAVVMAA